MLFDLPLEQLQRYQPVRNEPADFDAFWQNTLTEARSVKMIPDLRAHDMQAETVEIFDVTFPGFAGQPIKGWVLVPRHREERLPCVVEYIGYGGGRGTPFDWLTWSAVGYAHFIMDTRGQGSGWLRGDTPDPETDGATPQVPGFMTRGIQSPASYYYRRLFTDAVRAVDAARAMPFVNGSQIILNGGSQGGGIAIAAAGLVPDVFAAMPDVPFLCDIQTAMGITDRDPYRELVQYCKIHRHRVEDVFRTLSYFEGMHFAVRARARALFSVGLMDDVCPPRTVFAAYNHYAGPKEIRVWPFNQHEGGQSAQTVEKIAWLRKSGL